ncbi:MAG TPA: EAL domain-containing protein, partial [Spongiibacteraceae bacterium]|nr:EAL domain-containing protein [Spongiibacteraceae bacterium]
KYADGTVALLRDAVAAANTAKELGRNRVYVLESDVELHTRREKLLKWIDKMNDLLDNDYLVLRAQPICPTSAAASVKHYEILLGLRDSDGVVNPPGEFIEAAECYNRMQRVDRWVIARTFSWLSELNEKQLSLPQLSINLSGNSLNDPTFLDFLVDQFGNFRVSPHTICFEITETATIKNLTNAADFIQQVKKIGCSFALDDFGTGLSSYEYLKHLPVDYLKIDGMFIVDIDKSPSDYAMVKSINEIAHFMGKKTIAEFVESDAIQKALDEIGVDYVLGYHVGQPILLSEVQTDR